MASTAVLISCQSQRKTALDTIHIRYCYFLIFNTAKHLATLVTCSGRCIFFSGKKLDYKSRPDFLFPVGKNPRIRVAPSDPSYGTCSLRRLPGTEGPAESGKREAADHDGRVGGRRRQPPRTSEERAAQAAPRGAGRGPGRDRRTRGEDQVGRRARSLIWRKTVCVVSSHGECITLYNIYIQGLGREKTIFIFISYYFVFDG